VYVQGVGVGVETAEVQEALSLVDNGFVQVQCNGRFAGGSCLFFVFPTVLHSAI